MAFPLFSGTLKNIMKKLKIESIYIIVDNRLIQIEN